MLGNNVLFTCTVVAAQRLTFSGDYVKPHRGHSHHGGLVLQSPSASPCLCSRSHVRLQFSARLLRPPKSPN